MGKSLRSAATLHLSGTRKKPRERVEHQPAEPWRDSFIHPSRHSRTHDWSLQTQSCRAVAHTIARSPRTELSAIKASRREKGENAFDPPLLTERPLHVTDIVAVHVDGDVCVSEDVKVRSKLAYLPFQGRGADYLKSMPRSSSAVSTTVVCSISKIETK